MHTPLFLFLWNLFSLFPYSITYMIYTIENINYYSHLVIFIIYTKNTALA